jgi:hypothetical protein
MRLLKICDTTELVFYFMFSSLVKGDLPKRKVGIKSKLYSEPQML